jgi:DNA-directed RNA polymerase subunit K/omega
MSSAIPAPPKKIVLARNENDDSENEDADVGGLQEEIDQSEDDDDSASKQTTDNDDSGSETDDDAISSVADDENEGGEVSGGEDEDAAGGEGSDEEGGGAAAVVSDKQNKTKKKRSASKKDTEDDLTLLGVPHGIHFDDDDDGDEEDDDADKDTTEYFQKLTSSVSESYIETYHPESMSHNYDEIQTLSRVVRDSAGFIVDDLHRTIPIMTKYEKTRVLGQRAKQLNEGSPAFIKVDSTVIDGYLIAVKELEQKKTPFIIRRPLPNGGSEYWRIQDLEIL